MKAHPVRLIRMTSDLMMAPVEKQRRANCSFLTKTYCGNELDLFAQEDPSLDKPEYLSNPVLRTLINQMGFDLKKFDPFVAEESAINQQSCIVGTGVYPDTYLCLSPSITRGKRFNTESANAINMQDLLAFSDNTLAIMLTLSVNISFGGPTNEMKLHFHEMPEAVLHSLTEGDRVNKLIDITAFRDFDLRIDKVDTQIGSTEITIKQEDGAHDQIPC
jgi:hypothetical protein